MSVEAWAIKHPERGLDWPHWEDSEAGIIILFTEHLNERWTNLWNEGYRAVRVRITEVEEGNNGRS